MVKIINGKKYDTAKAELIAEWENSYNLGDFHHCAELLYKTKKGNYFLWGEGGALSKYAQSAGSNATKGGEGITPLTKNEAFEWMEENASSKEIQSEFSDMVEDA